MADNLDAYKCVLFHHNAERSNKQTARKGDGKSAMWWEEYVGAGLLVYEALSY